MAYRAFAQSQPGSIGDNITPEELDNAIVLSVEFIVRFERDHATQRNFTSEYDASVTLMAYFNAKFVHRREALPKVAYRRPIEVVAWFIATATELLIAMEIVSVSPTEQLPLASTSRSMETGPLSNGKNRTSSPSATQPGTLTQSSFDSLSQGYQPSIDGTQSINKVTTPAPIVVDQALLRPPVACLRWPKRSLPITISDDEDTEHHRTRPSTALGDECRVTGSWLQLTARPARRQRVDQVVDADSDCDPKKHTCELMSESSHSESDDEPRQAWSRADRKNI